MLVQEITYTNYNGQKRTGKFYFNLNQRELRTLALGRDGMSYQDYLRKIMEDQDFNKLMDLLKDIILMAYGERSEDGESFVKSDAIREKFEYSAAFDALYESLARDDEAALNFFMGLLPGSIRGEMTQERMDEIHENARANADMARELTVVDVSMFTEAKPVGVTGDADTKN